EDCKEDNSEHQNLLRHGSLLRGRGPWDTAWLAPIFGRAMPRRKTLRQNPACPPGPCLLARPFGARSQPFRRGACPARGKPRGEIAPVCNGAFAPRDALATSSAAPAPSGGARRHGVCKVSLSKALGSAHGTTSTDRLGPPVSAGDVAARGAAPRDARVCLHVPAAARHAQAPGGPALAQRPARGGG